MIQSLNFPVSKYCIQPYGGWDELNQRIKALGLDGVEAIWDPDDLDDTFLATMLTGCHLIFYCDWVDFYRQDQEKLLRKFGSAEMIRKVYGGTEPEDLMFTFREDLYRAIRYGADYMVFHVSDVSLEESYTYRWEHTDYEVLDAAIDVINDLLRGVEPTFDFLVENQWWPGFTFTEPEKTEYLLSHINYPRVGIMLDTGHLMNSNTSIRSQAEGIKWIMGNIERHGALAKRIYGLHFHQSVSGAYVKTHTGSIPGEYNGDFFHDFGVNYPHIQSIDRHLPWTNPDCVKILDAVQPKYLTHELSSRSYHSQLSALKRQLHTIRKGYAR